jgi:hypothetical protein
VPIVYTALQTTIYSESTSNNVVFRDNLSKAKLVFDNSTQTYTFPAASGTIALTSNLSSYVPYTGATASVNLGMYYLTAQFITGTGGFETGLGTGLYLRSNSTATYLSTGYVSLVSNNGNNFNIAYGSSTKEAILVGSGLTSSRSFTFPDASGTIALTSNLSAYLPLTGGTLTGALSGTSATFSTTLGVTGNATFSNNVNIGGSTTDRFGVTGTGGTTGFVRFTDGVTAALFFGVNSGTPYLHSNNNTLSFGATGANTFSPTMTLSSGNVGIGTSSPNTYSAFGTGIGLDVASSTTNAPANINIVGNGSGYAGLNLGNATIRRAGIFAEDGSVLTFYTNGSNSGTSVTERMRLQSNGVLKIGRGVSPDDGINPSYPNVAIAYNVSSDYGEIQAVQQTINVKTLRLNNAGGAVYAGAVRLDTLSDERMKTDITSLDNTLHIIKKLKPKKFHLIDEEEGKMRYGFIAQELEGILDEFVYNTDMKYKNEESGYEVENIKSIENWGSSWSALLVKAIQEQQAQIEELKEIIKSK